MKTYVIGYDLNKPGKDYAKLIEAIKAIGLWWHYLDSTWIVKTNLSATQIRETLQPPTIDPNDELLVVRLQGEHAGWLTTDAHKWLDENLTLV